MMSANIRIETPPVPETDASQGDAPQDAAGVFSSLLIGALTAGAELAGDGDGAGTLPQGAIVTDEPADNADGASADALDAFPIEAAVLPAPMPMPLPAPEARVALSLPSESGDALPPAETAPPVDSSEGETEVGAGTTSRSAFTMPERTAAHPPTLGVRRAEPEPQTDVAPQDATVREGDAPVAQERPSKDGTEIRTETTTESSSSVVKAVRLDATTAPVAKPAPSGGVIAPVSRPPVSSEAASAPAALSVSPDGISAQTVLPARALEAPPPADKILLSNAEPVSAEAGQGTESGTPATLLVRPERRMATADTPAPVENSDQGTDASTTELRSPAPERRADAKVILPSGEKPSRASEQAGASRADTSAPTASSGPSLNVKSETFVVRTPSPVTVPAAEAGVAPVVTETANTLANAESDLGKGGSPRIRSRTSGRFAKILDAAAGARRADKPAAEPQASVQKNVPPVEARDVNLQVEEPAAESAGMPVGAPAADTVSTALKSPVPAVQHSPLPRLQVLPGAARTDMSAFSQDAVGRAVAKAERLQTLIENMDRFVLSAVSSRDKSMTVTLIPEHLGKVVLNCREENGSLWIEIQASNPAARDLLTRNEETIRGLMDQAGYKLAQFDVRGETANENSGFLGKHSGREREEPDARPDPESRPPSAPARSRRGVGASAPARQPGIWVVA